MRSSADDSSLDVYLFTSGSSPTLLASATLSASVKLEVIGVEIADVYAGGAPHVLVAYADSTVDVLWLSAGADALYRAASFRLDRPGDARAGGACRRLAQLVARAAGRACARPARVALPRR